MVVRRQRRVTQDIAHIRRPQHIQASAHRHVVDGAAHAGYDIDEGLAVGHALGILLGTYQLEIPRPHAHVDRHAVRVAEVYIALDVERVVVIGIDGEVLQQQLRIDNAYGVVVEAQHHAIGDALQIGRVQEDFAIDLGRRQAALDGHLTLAIAMQAEQLVGHETVD